MADDRFAAKLLSRGVELEQWRLVCGYTRNQIAAAVGRHINSVIAWEHGGKIANEDLEKLVKLGFPVDKAYMGIKTTGEALDEKLSS